MQIRENGVYIEAIKLAAGSVQYKDISVKGDETFTQNADGSIVWDSKGNDIYYQGEMEQKNEQNQESPQQTQGNGTRRND